jgi:uncharacterized protein (TIGR02996 family)
MRDDKGLLHAVLDAANDDVPRLVYADWLEENGQSERAEFVRVQVEMARLPRHDARRTALRERNRALWVAHANAWLAEEVPKWARLGGAVYRRGFLSAMRCTAAQWLKEGARLRKRGPLQHLLLEHVRPAQMRALADCASLASITGLSRANTIFSTPELKALLGSPHLAHLELLNLPGRSSTSIVPALLSPGLESLRMLGLANQRIGVGGAAALAVFPQLTALDVANNVLGPEGAEALLSSPALANLTHLNLATNFLGQRGGEAVTVSPSLERLEVLNLFGNRIGPAAARALAAAPSVSNLAVLNLYGNYIGDEGAAALAASPNLRNLRVLEVGSNGLRRTGIEALAQSPHLRNLRRLYLADNEVNGPDRSALNQLPLLAPFGAAKWEQRLRLGSAIDQVLAERFWTTP